MPGPIFKEVGKRNANDAQLLAHRFSDLGLSSLALLGIANGLLNDAMQK
jgi:hypothetical protein